MTSPTYAAMSFDAAFARSSSRRGSASRLSFGPARSMDSTSSMTLTRRGRGRVSLRLPFFFRAARLASVTRREYSVSSFL